MSAVVIVRDRGVLTVHREGCRDVAGDTDAQSGWDVDMRRAASITLTAPDQRNHTNARSYPMDRWQMPFDQLLPAVARASTCHLAYDTRLHRSNREASRRGDLIPLFAADETP